MELTELLQKDLTDEQKARLREFKKAAERIADMVCYGDLIVKYHQGRAESFDLLRRVRVNCD